MKLGGAGGYRERGKRGDAHMLGTRGTFGADRLDLQGQKGPGWLTYHGNAYHCLTINKAVLLVREYFASSYALTCEAIGEHFGVCLRCLIGASSVECRGFYNTCVNY